MKVFYFFLLMLIGITVDLVGQESKFDTMNTTVKTDVGSYKLPVLVTPFFETESEGEALTEVKGWACFYAAADGQKHQIHLVSSGGKYYVFALDVDHYQATGQWYSALPQFGTEGIIQIEYLHPMTGQVIGYIKVSPNCLFSEIHIGSVTLRWQSQFFCVYTSLREQTNRKAYALLWKESKKN